MNLNSTMNRIMREEGAHSCQSQCLSAVYSLTSVCEAAYPTLGHREPDSLFGALKLSFRKQLENPYKPLPYR